MDKTLKYCLNFSVDIINFYGVYIILICEIPHSEITLIYLLQNNKIVYCVVEFMFYLGMVLF